MKRLVVVLLMFVVVVSMGCGGGKESEKKSIAKKSEISKSGTVTSLMDPVDKQPVDVLNAKYSYVYKNVEYLFNTEEHMKAFKQDPEKYLVPKE